MFPGEMFFAAWGSIVLYSVPLQTDLYQRFPKGTTMIFTGETQQEWIKVLISDRTGWVHGEYVKKL